MNNQDIFEICAEVNSQMMAECIEMSSCWCGSKLLEPFSEHYQICRHCGTLMAKRRLLDNEYEPGDKNKNFYGKDYWTEYIKKEYGYPDVFECSRIDLAGRCLHWLKNILKYKLPSGKTLELGCAHGGLVFMMKLAGFDAHGAEMSPWLCKFAADTFMIPMACGRIEDISIIPKSLDMIIIMDVLEHMTDPAGSLKRMAHALKDDGSLVIQTPHYDSTKTYEMMNLVKDVFLEQLKEKEHLYLFTRESIERLLKQEGFTYISFEPPFFPYDMFLFASKSALKQHSENEIQDYLLSSANGRVIVALLDLFDEKTIMMQKLMESENDREARLKIINELNKRLEESEADRGDRLITINELGKRLEESKADRGDRLQVIKALETRLKQIDIDNMNLSQIINNLKVELSNKKDIIKKIDEELNNIKRHWLYCLIRGKEPKR